MMKRLFLIAGAALSLGTSAQAQTLDQSRAQSAELFSDAASRTSSLAPQAQDFTVAVHGYEQFRFNWNSRDDQGLDGNDNDQTIGFQNARTRLNFSGNIANENWSYFIQFGFGDAESGAFLEDAYGDYKMGDGWSLRFGQFKLPLFHEELVGDTYQLFADRSVANTHFTQGRSQGIQAAYTGDQFRFYGAFSDGIQTANTDFNSSSEADFALTARGEFKWNGDWKQYKDFTSFQNSDYFGVVGAAIHWQTGGDTVPTNDVDVFAITVDATVEGNGWNVYGAFGYTDIDPAIGNKFADYFFLIQGGIFVAADWEIIGGIDFLSPDSDHGTPGDGNFTTIRLGVNHYIVPESHAAKLTIDWTYFLDNPSECAIADPSTSTGLLSSNEDTQWNLRGQIQLMF